MRYAVLIIALIGAVACTGLGWKVKSETESDELRFAIAIKEAMENESDEDLQRSGMNPARVRESIDKLNNLLRVMYCLLAVAPLAVGAGLLAMFRRGIPAGLILFVCGFAPLAFQPLAILFTFPLPIAGLLALFVKPPRKPKIEVEDDAEEDSPPRATKVAAKKPREAVKAVPPPTPVAKIGCPKCKSALKVPNPKEGGVIKCPKCAAGLRITAQAVERARLAAEEEASKRAAALAEQTQEDEPEVEVEEEEAPSPKSKRAAARPKKQGSRVPAIVGSCLLVAVSAGASAAIGMGLLGPGDSKDREKHKFSKRDKGDDPFKDLDKDKDKDKDKDDGKDVVEPPLDEAEEARRAAARAKKLEERQKHEKELLAEMRKRPPEEEIDGLVAQLPGSGKFFIYSATVLSPDAEWLAVIEGGDADIWELRTGKVAHNLKSNGNGPMIFAFSPDSRQMVLKSEDEPIRVLDVKTGMLKKKLEIAGHADHGAAFAPDGKSLVTSGYHKDQFKSSWKVWNTETWTLIREVDCDGHFSEMAFTTDGNSLLVRDIWGEGILVFDGISLKRKRKIKIDKKFNQFVVSPDGKSVLVFSSEDKEGRLGFHDIRTGKSLESITGADCTFTGVSWSPDGRLLATLGVLKSDLDTKKGFRLWEGQPWKLRSTKDQAHQRNVEKILFSSGGLFVVTSDSRHVRVWDLAAVLNPTTPKPKTVTVEEVKKFAEVETMGDRHTLRADENLTNEQLAVAAKLPGLVTLFLGGQSRITDAGLVHLKEAKSLEHLDLGSTNISAAGLAGLAGLNRLHTLNLSRVKLGEKGLTHLKGLPALTSLQLDSCGLTDAGLSPVAEFGKLTTLNLSGNQMLGAAGLAHLAKLSSLKNLYLNQVPVTDAGLAHLKGLKELTALALSGDKVTDAGFAHLVGLTEIESLSLSDAPNLKGPFLEHLKGMKNLEGLSLTETGVTDDGLKHAKELTQLTDLELPERITDAGLAHLAGLTKLRHLGGPFTNIKGPGLAHLKGMKELRGLELVTSGVDDAGLAPLKEMTQLQMLDLPRRITNAGLAHIAGLTNLTVLDIGGADVGDAGLAHLKGMTKLTTLNVHQTKITDAGLAHLKGMTALMTLTLAETGIGDAGLAHLKGLPELAVLILHGTKVGDAGLVHLKELKKLKAVTLSKTAVTDKGIEQLKKDLPNVRIEKD